MIRTPPVGGSRATLSSIIRNRKLTTVIGAILIVVGIVGMVSIGSAALETIRRETSVGVGAEYQQAQYVFLFVMIAGLIILIYSAISIQADKAKARRKNDNR